MSTSKLTFHYGDHAALIQFAEQYTDSSGFMHDSKIYAAAIDGELAACVVYQCFTEESADIHFGAVNDKYWTRRALISTLLKCGFKFAGADKLIAKVPTDNTACLVACLKLGFQPTGYLAGSATRGYDVMVLEGTEETLLGPRPETRKVTLP